MLIISEIYIIVDTEFQVLSIVLHKFLQISYQKFSYISLTVSALHR